MAVWKNVLQILIFELLTGIVKGLAALLLLGDIDELTRNSILEFSNMVNTHLARNYAMVRKGAEDIMGGKILEYEAKTIYQNGVRLGREEKENSMIISMLKNKLSQEQIVTITGLTMEKIVSIGRQAAVL